MGAGVAEIRPKSPSGRILTERIYYRGISFGPLLTLGERRAVSEPFVPSYWCVHKHRTIDAALACGRRLSKARR